MLTDDTGKHPGLNTSSDPVTPLILSFFEFPILSAHGTQLMDLLGVQPFHNAMDVETMGTLSPN